MDLGWVVSNRVKVDFKVDTKKDCWGSIREYFRESEVQMDSKRILRVTLPQVLYEYQGNSQVAYESIEHPPILETLKA